MGKIEFVSPKAIANKTKAKGLKKLKFYCQMCCKECKDANGFKCHCLSDSHVRQMEVFGVNRRFVIDGYSQEFEKSFLNHVKTSHRFSRISAAAVYNEFISDRHHIHMNSTKWLSLTDFVKFLGKTGKCKVDDTLKGWFLTYIGATDAEMVFKKERKRKRISEDQEWDVRRQIVRAAAQHMITDNEVVDQQPPNKVFKRDPSSDGCKIKLKLEIKSSVKEKKGDESSRFIMLEEDEAETQYMKEKFKKDSSGKFGALDELMREQDKEKEERNRKDYWLCQGIVVKVMSKPLAGKGYYKQKGVVRKVIDKYVGEIKMIETKHVLRVDQEELQTVIPQIGSLVRIVNGAYCGSNAKLLAIDTTKFCAKVQIDKGLYDGKVLPAVEYDDICKFCSDTSM